MPHLPAEAEVHGFVCDLAEQSRALKARAMNAVQGLKELIANIVYIGAAKLYRVS